MTTETITRRPNRTRFQDSPVASPHHGWEIEERRYTSRSRFEDHGRNGKRPSRVAIRQERRKRAQYRTMREALHAA